MKLWIASFLDKETINTQEFRFAFDLLIIEANKVFDQIAVAKLSLHSLPNSSDGKLINPPDDADFTLILGHEPVFLSAASMSRMQKALAQGANGVVPLPVEQYPEAALSAIYTLSDYQHLESQLLEQNNPVPTDLALQYAAQISLWRTSVITPHWPEIFSLMSMRKKKKSELLDVFAAQTIATAGVIYSFSDYYSQTRKEILPYVPKYAKDVLDVGCGHGFTGAYLQQQLGCRVSGVEVREAVAARAERHLHKVFNMDIESMHIEERYDVVMALDVIEHLRDPQEFLSWAKQHLVDKGTFISIVPNVGHYSVVKDLAGGRWDYVPAGILCVSHLRFFTRSSIELMLRMAGFGKWKIEAKRSPLPEDVKEWVNRIDGNTDSLSTEAFYVIATV